MSKFHNIFSRASKNQFRYSKNDTIIFYIIKSHFIFFCTSYLYEYEYTTYLPTYEPLYKTSSLTSKEEDYYHIKSHLLANF